MKKHEDMRKKLHRSECKVRDLTVEIRYMSDLIHQLREEAASRMEYVNSRLYVDPPEYSSIYKAQRALISVLRIIIAIYFEGKESKSLVWLDG